MKNIPNSIQESMATMSINSLIHKHHTQGQLQDKHRGSNEPPDLVLRRKFIYNFF